jgi:hypothetical protein
MLNQPLARKGHRGLRPGGSAKGMAHCLLGEREMRRLGSTGDPSLLCKLRRTGREDGIGTRRRPIGRDYAAAKDEESGI